MAGVWRGTKGAKFMFMSSASHEQQTEGRARSGSGEGRNLIKKAFRRRFFHIFSLNISAPETNCINSENPKSQLNESSCKK